MTMQITGSPVRPATAAAPQATDSDAPKEPIEVRLAEKAPEHDLFIVTLDDQSTEQLQKAWDMPVSPERRKFVYDTLLETTRKTQEPLWKVLDGLKRAGHVEDYKPFWIQNSIAVVGDESARSAMASAAGVGNVQAAVAFSGPSAPKLEDSLPLASEGDDNELKAKEAPADPDAPIDQWNLEQVNMQAARDAGLTGKGVTIGVLDTGVDGSHPALLTNFRGYDAETGAVNLTGNWFDATEVRSKEMVDDSGHGTHVTGTAVGSDGRRNQIGGAPGSKWFAARGLGPDGGTDKMLLDGLQYLAMPLVPDPAKPGGSVRSAELGAHIINNSWGSNGGLDTSYTIAMRNLAAMGVIPVTSAGNDGRTGPVGSVGSPANTPWVISVAATDKENNPAEFSSRGPSPLNLSMDQEPTPFIGAPGVDIRSSVPGGGYERGWNGTSMAGPLVAAAIANIQEAAKDETGYFFDIRGVKQVLQQTAKDVGPEGVDTGTGFGLLNMEGVRDAVKAAAATLGIVPKDLEAQAVDLAPPTGPVVDEPAPEAPAPPEADDSAPGDGDDEEAEAPAA